MSDRNMTDSEIKTLNDLKLNPTQALGLKNIASMSRVTHSGFLFRYGKQFVFIYSIYISISIYIHIRLGNYAATQETVSTWHRHF